MVLRYHVGDCVGPANISLAMKGRKRATTRTEHGFVAMTSFTFVPYQTKIASEFWQLLSQRKIDKDKLDNHDNFITATIDVATASTAPRLDLTQASFDTERYHTEVL